MSEFNLNLFEDRLEAGEEIRWPLAQGYRIIYVVAGEIDIAAAGQSSTQGENSAWFGTGACVARAAADGARLWRWELVGATGQAAEDSVHPGPKASHAVSLDPREEYLMRCDRVDFPPGGIAYTHTHAGSGTRCLLQGELRVTVQQKTITARPGDPWFERGPDPVLASASATEQTSFVRTMILPRSYRGRSSIRYVKSEDADKPKLQEYTRFVEEDIEIDAQ
jgi:quercetin dioxygenase-like cupin family protein